MQEMDVIIDACDGFHAKSKNEALKAELLPFTNSLKELCKSIRSFVEAQIAIENDDMYAAFNSYTAGSSSFKTSKTFTKPMINGNPQVVSPGSTHLIPLAEKLEKKLSGPINDYAVSYTHLDVYKRQILLKAESIRILQWMPVFGC